MTTTKKPCRAGFLYRQCKHCPVFKRHHRLTPFMTKWKTKTGRKNNHRNNPNHRSNPLSGLRINKSAKCTFFHPLMRISRISIFQQKHFSFFISDKNQATLYLLGANRTLQFSALLPIIIINRFLYFYETQKISFWEVGYPTDLTK